MSLFGSTTRSFRGVAASAAACALLAGVLAATAAPAAAAPGDPVYSPQPLDTWTVTGGQIYAMARLGDRIVIGGSFTGLRSPAGTTTPRARLALVNANTGAPDPLWNPGANNTVRALATDGTHVYAGGTFTTIGGVARTDLASLSAATGAVDTAFQANGNGEVRSLLLSNGRLYAGGLFTTVNGVQRVRAAAVSPATGALDTVWKPQASWAVNGMAAIPGTSLIALGGEFATVSTQPRRYLASVDKDTGAVSAWAPPPDCTDTTNPCVVRAVVATAGLVYAAVGGPGGRVSAYDVATAVRTWSQHGDGDVQSLALIGGTIYGGGHYDPQFGSTSGITQTRHEIAAMDSATGALQPFAPVVAGATGVWAILADPDGLRIGGSFTSVNGDTTVKGFATFPPVPPPVTLVPAGAIWSYHDDGTDLGTAWTDPAYDSSAWPTGPAELGFGDGDEATVVSKGHVTYYFRNGFTVPDGVTPSALLLEVVRDDGAVVYLNGVEVWRDNLPAGPISATTLAPSAIGGDAEKAWNAVTIPATALHAGANVISVEIHQAALTSSDISMNLRLTTS